MSETKAIHSTEVGDAGIEHLASLANLEYLNLYGTKITDKSLEGLARLKKLERLYVWRTGVTDAGVAKLAKALPDIAARYDALLVDPALQPLGTQLRQRYHTACARLLE